jgi:NAD(P)-dependent dehydrogenase (short-subunit alcohol dehydrogenase family)
MKTAIITGCNGGLGKTLLRSFAEGDYNIIACVYPDSEDFNEYSHSIENEYGVTIRRIVFNSISQEDLMRGIYEIEEIEDPIDVLVNNAGISIIKPIFNVEYEDLEKIFKINYFSTVMISKVVARKMIRQEGGSIVNITSMVSLGHQPGGSLYDASKAAMNQLTKSMAQELAGFNIRVNAVAAAPMNTDMFKGLTEKTQKHAIKAIAMKRPAETEEVANAVMFLVSEKASFITGDILRVDGGAIV